MRIAFLIASFLLPFIGNKPIHSNPLFKITIDRKIKGVSCTQGYLLVNDSPIAYCLELPDKDNDNYISSIPKETYSATIRTDGPKGWRIALLDVPNRENIQIHVGNYTSDITGCIVPGKKISLDDCSVSDSRPAMQDLEIAFNAFTKDLILNQGSTSPIDIQVEITGL